MSKSKRNTIDPENMINNYGADAVRFFILSDSPPEKDVQWSESGMISSYKFIQKFWILCEQILDLIKNDPAEKSDEIEIFTNQSINKINFSLEKFRYNVLIAICHEIYTFWKKILDKKKNFKNLKNNFEKILLIMMPILPHITNECLDKLNFKDEFTWPKVDQKYIKKEKNEIVIQINGKKRNLISVESNITEKQLLIEIDKSKLIEKYVKNKKLKK